MPFANFYVGETEINKQFKGCYRHSAPPKGAVGTLSGEWIPSPLQNIKPIQNTDIPGLWVFAGYDGVYVKMVGMMYGKGSGNSQPQRVDGRAMEASGNQSIINSETIPYLWENASIKDIGEQEYTLTISNNSPLQSINQCMEQASQSGTSIFSITNMNSNGLGQCVIGEDVETPQGTLLDNVDEPECLQNKGASTVYTVETSEGNSDTLGKTYLGKSDGDNKKMTFHEYPDSMLSMGEKYVKHGNFDSRDNNLSNASISDASSAQCKQYCINRGQECKGFVYDKTNNNCALKGEIYPTSKREINKNKDIYTRMPSINNNKSCPNGVSAVNTDFLNKNGFLSSDQMSLDFQCDTEANVSKELNSLDASYEILTDEVVGLRKENNRILKGFRELSHDVHDKTKDYHEVQKKIKKRKNNHTVNRLLMDTEQLQSAFSMRNTGLALALLLLSIFLLRVLRK